MRHVTGFLALGALCLAGFSTVTALGLARDLRARDAAPDGAADAHAALEARLGALELAVMLSTTSMGTRPPALTDERQPPMPPASSGTSDPSSTTGLAPSPRAMPTIQELERRLAEIERQVASGAAAPAPTDAGPNLAPPLPSENATRFLGSVQDAEKHLELTPAQTADVEQVVADAAREREALHRLPAEDGTTWEDAARDSVRVLGEGLIQYDGEKLAAFRDRQVPGRNESFGAADRRISEAAKRRIEAGLSPDQRKRFEQANVDGLVGASSSGAFSFSFGVAEGDAPETTDGK